MDRVPIGVMLLLLCGGGCTGGTSPTASDQTLPTGDTAPPVVVVPEATEDGDILLQQNAGWIRDTDGSTLFGAMFVESTEGVLNLTQCVSSTEAFCATTWPSGVGESVLVASYDPAIVESINTLDAGDSVSLGPFVAFYNYDAANDLGFYFETWPDATPPVGVLSVDISGGPEWPAGTFDDALPAPTPMVMTSHDPMADNEFLDADTIALRWESGGVGDAYLLVSTPAELRLHWLEDTGAYDLDLRPLGLTDGAEVVLWLGRWSRAEFEVDGRDVTAMIQYNQPLSGVWRSIGPRVDLPVADSCAQAQSAAGVGEGYYSGDFTGFSDDLNPGPQGCTGFAASAADAIVPIDVLPDQELTVDYSLLSDDASAYLLLDCANAASCVTGSDTPGTEHLEWRNDDAAVRRVYLVLDGFDQVTDGFRLDIDLSNRGGDILTNSCADAIDQGPVEPGVYDGTIVDHINLIPEYPSCASSGPGGEGIAEVFLASGETLTATVTVPSGNPGVHLLTNCSIGDSCFAVGIGEIVYTNEGAFGQTFFVVLDSVSGLADYTLEIAIQ